MKKRFALRLLFSLTITCATTFLFAQDQNSVAAHRPKSMQASLIAALIDAPHSTSASTVVYVKAKVMRSFISLFADAANVKWTTGNGQYFVSFTQNDKLCNAAFTSDGALVRSLQYGTEKDLPREVRKLLKSNYLDYKIDAVTDLTTNDLKAWVVNLTDANSLIVASVCDGNLEELHNYKTHF